LLEGVGEGVGGRVKSYDGEIAWPSTHLSILSVRRNLSREIENADVRDGCGISSLKRASDFAVHFVLVAK